MSKIVICPTCNYTLTYEKWYEQDNPDCANCGYPLHPDLEPTQPVVQKQSFLDKILSFLPVSTPPIYIYKLADVSVYNGTEASINFDLFFSKVNGVIARSSAGANYYDPMFEVWKREANKRKVPFGQYHYFKPDKNLDAQAALIEQAHSIGEINFPMDLDVEVNPFVGQVGDKQKMADNVYKVLKRIEVLLPLVKQMIYTSPGFWNGNVARNDFAKHCMLHVAHWGNMVEPTLPNDWSAISNPVKETFWQKQLDPAFAYGLPSSKVDINFFRGTKTQFFDLFGVYPYEGTVVPPTPGTWPVPTEPIKFKVLTDSLNVRTGPGVRFPVINKLKKDDVVYAHSVDAPSEAWVEIAPGNWAAYKFSGTKFLEEL